MTPVTRREFLGVAAAAAAGAASAGAGQPVHAASPAKLERRKFGATDMEVTVLGFGAAEIGYEKVDQAVIDRLLNSALDAGLNVIDTAECYPGSEEAIGKAVGHRRHDYFVFTKVGHADPEGWSAPSIERSIDRSLQRLRTDRVDLVQLHSCGRDVLERGECIQALEKTKKAGKTRYIGYSGDSAAALYAIETGRFDSLQTSLSIADQEPIGLTLPKAREKNMGVIAKRPIANAVWRNDKDPGGYSGEYWRRLQRLDYPFTKGERRSDEGPNGAAGMALRFTLAAPGVDVAIVGTSKPERWKKNAELLRAGGPLTPAEFEEIRRRWKDIAEAGWTGQT